MTMSRSGTSSSSSSVAVPCPAITSALSNGWISVAPVSRCTSAHAASRAATVGAQKRTVAPKPRTLATLIAGAFSGITTCAGMPRRDAAYASAAPWLPDECVTTPRAASAADNENTALVAPRALNAPTFCRFSHLKYSTAPAASSSDAECMTGVRWTQGAIRAAARRMASRSGSASSGAPVEACSGAFIVGQNAKVVCTTGAKERRCAGQGPCCASAARCAAVA